MAQTQGLGMLELHSWPIVGTPSKKIVTNHTTNWEGHYHIIGLLLALLYSLLTFCCTFQGEFEMKEDEILVVLHSEHYIKPVF